jgi:hypothetical protein
MRPSYWQGLARAFLAGAAASMAAPLAGAEAPAPATAATTPSDANAAQLTPVVDAAATASASDTPAGSASAEPAREARDLSLQRPIGKRWQLLGEVQYRALAVRDADPANDQRMLYGLQGSYALRPELLLAARVGLEQRFVRVDDESGVRFTDSALSALYQQSLSLAPLGWDRPLSLVHRLRVLLPTSFRSQQDDLLLATDWMTRARVRVTGQLFAGLRGLVQYRAHQFAEQAGPGGPALPRLVAEALAFAEYSPIVSPELGTLTLGGDVYADQTIDYPSRDPGSLDAADLPPGTLDSGDVLGAGTTDTFASPHFGFDLYVIYQPPVEHVLLMASLEQAGNAARYGETRLYLFHRDETEVALRVLLSY